MGLRRRVASDRKDVRLESWQKNQQIPELSKGPQTWVSMCVPVFAQEKTGFILSGQNCSASWSASL